MARFYDTANEAEQIKVEQLLRRNGVGYFLSFAPSSVGKIREIFVAEEDLPRAEELLIER